MKDLICLKRYPEARDLAREQIPLAKGVFGDDCRVTLMMRRRLAVALYFDPDASLGDLVEAAAILEDVSRRWLQVFGSAHPELKGVQDTSKDARRRLAMARAGTPVTWPD